MRLALDEAEIAARFLVGRALPREEEKHLQVSGRAIWRIASQEVNGEDRGEEIFAAATDFGEARQVLERLVGEGDLVLLMGAGDIWKLGDELAYTD